MPPFEGMRFGRYELLARLGAGGMGEVWRARDHDLGRQVAVKFLPERYAANRERLSRFLQEARAASSLNHPNIVTIHDFGETSGLPYIVMELVSGHTLRARLRERGPLPPKQVIEIGAQVAEGLAKAHAEGIVHRDLKPDNVMLTDDGFAKILDFGLAKLRGDGSDGLSESADTVTGSPVPQTATGIVLGTASYMSPEQAHGSPVDHRSDQFSLGAILYELATGRRAFLRDSVPATLLAVVDVQLEPIAASCPAFPAQAAWVIERRCLAKDPADRYASTSDIARELRLVRDRIVSGSDDAVTPPWSAPVPHRRRRPALAAAAVAVLLVVFASLAWLWSRAAPEKLARPPVVAVLPLTNLTGQSEEEATAAGIGEVVVASLTRIPELQVLSRSATQRYRERKGNLPAIGRELDATFLLDGTIQRSRDQVRVSLTLVPAASNVVAWSGTFDGAYPQLFELQSRVAAGVARALRVGMPAGARRQVATQPPRSAEAWKHYVGALALLGRPDQPGNVERALALLESSVGADAAFAPARALLAEAALRRHEDTGDGAWAERATEEAQEALRLDPADARVRITLARVLSRRGLTDAALAEARAARDLLPSSDEVARLHSGLLVDAGKADAALAEARRALELRPGFAENHAGLGLAHFSSGRFPQAAQAFARAVELAPENAWFLQMLGTARHVAGDLDGAVTAYRQSLRLAPDSRSWANLGAIQYERSRMPEALHAYEEAVRLESGSSTIRRSLGDTRAKSGDAAGARADWTASAELSRAALKVNPRDPRQLKNLALCLGKLGSRDEAIATAAEAIGAGPASADAHYGAAAVHALTGDRRRALELLARAFELGASRSVAASDDDLRSLRGMKEFQTLLRKKPAPTEK